MARIDDTQQATNQLIAEAVASGKITGAHWVHTPDAGFGFTEPLTGGPDGGEPSGTYFISQSSYTDPRSHAEVSVGMHQYDWGRQVPYLFFSDAIGSTPVTWMDRQDDTADACTQPDGEIGSDDQIGVGGTVYDVSCSSDPDGVALCDLENIDDPLDNGFFLRDTDGSWEAVFTPIDTDGRQELLAAALNHIEVRSGPTIRHAWQDFAALLGQRRGRADAELIYLLTATPQDLATFLYTADLSTRARALAVLDGYRFPLSVKLWGHLPDPAILESAYVYLEQVTDAAFWVGASPTTSLEPLYHYYLLRAVGQNTPDNLVGHDEGPLAIRGVVQVEGALHMIVAEVHPWAFPPQVLAHAARIARRTP